MLLKKWVRRISAWVILKNEAIMINLVLKQIRECKILILMNFLNKCSRVKDWTNYSEKLLDIKRMDAWVILLTRFLLRWCKGKWEVWVEQKFSKVEMELSHSQVLVSEVHNKGEDHNSKLSMTTGDKGLR